MATTIEPAESQLLLAHVLGVGQAYLLANPEPQLNPWQRWRYARLQARRAAGVPVAYLLGEKWFYGRPYYVNRDTLIPRPETETLVEVVRGIVGARRASPLLVDVGTGSGCIAVTLAAELNVPVIATDVSRRALAVAHRNARRNGVAGLITFLRGSLLQPLRLAIGDGRPTIVVANLPYLPADHPVNQTPFEPASALYGGGADGLGLIRALVEQCRGEKFCAPTAIVLEIDPRQAAAVRSLLADRLPAGNIHIHDDLSGRPRVAVWIKRGT